MSVRAKDEAAAAVAQLRRFISLHEGVEVAPGSPLANQLEAAQRAVAATNGQSESSPKPPRAIVGSRLW